MAIDPFKSSHSLDQILQRVYDNDGRRLRVDASGITLDAVIGDVQIEPGDAFRANTLTVTTSPQAITLSGFAIRGIIIKSLSENPGYIRVGNASLAAGSFYLLSPGETLNIPIKGDVSPIYAMLHAGQPAGTYEITVLAVNG